VDHIDFISSHAEPAWHISTFPGSCWYPRAVHKRFRRDEDAHEWLAERIDPPGDLNEDDDATFTTVPISNPNACPYTPGHRRAGIDVTKI
jgi:hypothetical protein